MSILIFIAGLVIITALVLLLKDIKKFANIGIFLILVGFLLYIFSTIKITKDLINESSTQTYIEQDIDESEYSDIEEEDDTTFYFE